MRRLLWFGALMLLVAGKVFADNTFDYNPKTGRLDLVLDNSNAGVITGSTATFTGYDCSVFSNGGTLTTDASGNLRCADDDSAAGSGDAITVNGSGATDANFADTPTISWTLQTATSPDTISGVVVAASIGTTQIGTDGVSADELNATGVEAELEAALDIAGDVASTGMASTVVQADAVALTTDTTGNYVESLTCSETMSGCVVAAEDSDQLVGVKGAALTAAHLNSSNAPTTGHVLSFAGPTTGKFTWVAQGAGSGDSLTVNGSAVSDANLVDTLTLAWNLNTSTDPDTVSGSVVANSIAETQLASTITLADGDYFNLASIDTSSATEGLRLPQSTASGIVVKADGQPHWENDADELWVGTGSGGVRVGAFPMAAASTTSRAVDFILSWGSGSSTGGEDAGLAPFAMTCRNFRATVDDAPGAGNQWDITLEEQGIATALACQIAGTANTCELLGVDEAIAMGTGIRAEFNETGTVAAASSQTWSMECYPDQ